MLFNSSSVVDKILVLAVYYLISMKCCSKKKLSESVLSHLYMFFILVYETEF